MKANRFFYSYSGSFDSSWIKIAEKICNQIRLTEVPDDIDEKAIVIDKEVRRIAKKMKINMRDWPESLIIEAE